MFRSLAKTVALYATRSSQWRKTRAAHLKEHPTCAVCGGKEHLEVHHIHPFFLFPEEELTRANLITLCEKPSMNCHFWIGHLGNWRSWNADVRMTAAYLLSLIKNRPKSN